MYNRTNVAPDFTQVKRQNLEYDNVYGAHTNINHPSWETGGDYAAVARQSFTTPGMMQRYEGVNNKNLQGMINGVTGRQGYPKNQMTKLYGQDDFTVRRTGDAIDLYSQAAMYNNARGASDDTSFAMYFLVVTAFLFILFLIFKQ